MKKTLLIILSNILILNSLYSQNSSINSASKLDTSLAANYVKSENPFASFINMDSFKNQLPIKEMTQMMNDIDFQKSFKEAFDKVNGSFKEELKKFGISLDESEIQNFKNEVDSLFAN